jgi:multidrug efflux pump
VIISDFSIKNRTAVMVLMALIAAVGAYSYSTLPREAFPDVAVPYVMVSTIRDGVSPADMESSVTMKIEKKLTGISGVKEIRSSSAEGMSLIMIEFLPDVKTDDAVQKVRDKVSQARADLPDDVKEPIVNEISFSDIPIMTVSISGPMSPVSMKLLADDLKDLIEVVPGVMSCTVTGALEREIRLEIDQDRVISYGLTIPELLALIPSENVNVSAGGLETQGTKFNVRMNAEFTNPEEVDRLLLATRNGMPIFLKDVATITDTFKDRDSLSRVNGRDSITLSIQKRTGGDGNIIEITDNIRAILSQAANRVPEGVKFDITRDSSAEIRRMVADLENHILSGIVLVLVVLLVFLGWRASLIVALAIPMSLLMSFTILQMMGYTLNMVVLFSLIMVLGMLVDDAIVIVENVWRHMQMGYGRFDAAMKGTSEVAWPVITSTATKVAAFAPMMFWPGMMGSFMKYLPITLVVTLSSSLFVALVINPTICAIAGGHVARRQKEPFLLRYYRRLIQLVVTYRSASLVMTVTLLVAMVMLYIQFGLAKGVEFFPEGDPKTAVINIRSPQGTNIHESDRLAKLIEKKVKIYAGYMDNYVSNVGSAGGDGMSGSTGGSHIATETLSFLDYDIRKTPSAEILNKLRQDVANIPGAEITVEKENDGPQTGAAVTVRIMGKDFKELQAISQQARELITNVPNLVNLRSDYEAAKPELAFQVDRQTAILYGVSTATIGNFLRTAIFGQKVSTYRQLNDEYDITIRLPLAQRVAIDDILRLQVPNNTGKAVPLSSLGRFAYVGGMGTINRINQNRVVTLTADNEGRQADMVLKDVQDRLSKLTQNLPEGYRIGYAGEKQEQDDASAFLFKAFIVALLLIWLVLVAEFNTLSVPMIIMSTVALSLIGVLVGLLVSGMPFCVIMTGVGVISLTGVVVANGIVLLDFIRKLQRRGMDVIQAAVQASTTRLRPVFLTAITAILGLLPMATGVSFDFHQMSWATRSESSQTWASMAIAVIYGLSFATVLTLLIVPALYVTVYRLLEKFGLGGIKQPDLTPQKIIETEDF